MHRLISPLWFLILLLLAVPTAAQERDGEHEPAAETAKARLDLPQEVERRFLANGVEVLAQHLADLDHAALLVLRRSGSAHDPADSPGLSRLFDRLLMTCPAEDGPQRSVADLNRMYRAGWNAMSFDTHAVWGVVVPREELAGEIEATALRLRTLGISDEAIHREAEAIREEMHERFERRAQLVPTAWLLAKAYRHDSGAPRGIDPDRLESLRATRVRQEWAERTVGGEIIVILVGAVDDDAVATAVNRAFGLLRDGPPVERRRTLRPAGGVAREIMNVTNLPARGDHAVAAFFAPPIAHEDHPAFLVVARAFRRDAAEMPGAEARPDFQYDLLLDARAAYLTPHNWRFPQGAGQALGFWQARIENRRFTRADIRRTLTAIGWQLGGDLPGAVVDEMERRPGLLYSIAYATGFRAVHGDEVFWSGYRERLGSLDQRALTAARERYFTRTNCALFVLRAAP